MAVDAKRPEYDANIDRWCIVRDVINSDVKSYIKDVDQNDPYRNSRYKDDAQFTNFTARTKSGLVGAVFRKELLVDLPDSIKYLKDDATGFKMSMSKLAQEVVGEVLSCGRYGLLVDYPASEDGLTAKEVADMNLFARIYRYKAESIINWQTVIVNGIPTLSLVVLKECFSDLDEDGFTWIENEQYRVLRLVNGIYVQSLYNKDLELVSVYSPRDSSGDEWDHIPFVFVGSEDNDAEVDAIPLYDLAKLNIGHLRNSADYEESIHIVGQPTLIIGTDMSPEEFAAANPNGVMIGARKGHNLGISGKAEFLQASPNQLADVAMQRKEEQAIMMGARLIVPQADRETAEAARMRHSGETSILATIASNVEDALVNCCKYVIKFMGNPVDEAKVSIKLNDQFFDNTIDPNYLMSQIQLLNSGLIAKADVRNSLRILGVIDESRTDQEIEAEATPAPVTQPVDNKLIV